MKKTIEASNKIGRLIRWTKNQNHKFKELSKMPTLYLSDVVAEFFEKKIEMLKKFLFYSKTIADLFDITTITYSQEVECPQNILENEIGTALLKQRPNKASDSKEILNRILKTLADLIINGLLFLVQANIKLKYHSKAFKETNIIILKKSGKKTSDYIVSKKYRSIILLNIMNKILKTVMIKKINHLTKSLNLFFYCQFETRFYRSTKPLFEMLIEEIHTM